jgi:hypothetical protein
VLGGDLEWLAYDGFDASARGVAVGVVGHDVLVILVSRLVTIRMSSKRRKRVGKCSMRSSLVWYGVVYQDAMNQIPTS